MRRTLIVLFALVLPALLPGTGQAQPADDYPGPGHPHFCLRYMREWPINFGTSGPSAQPDERNLEGILAAWREDRGEIMLKGWTNAEEHARSGFRDSIARVNLVRDRLITAGVPREAIYVQVGGMENIQPAGRGALGWAVGTVLSNRGLQCESRNRKRRLEWVRSNCLGGTPRGTLLDRCNEQLAWLD